MKTVALYRMCSVVAGVWLILLATSSCSTDQAGGRRDQARVCDATALRSMADNSLMNGDPQLVLVFADSILALTCTPDRDSILLRWADVLHVAGIPYLRSSRPEARRLYGAALKLRQAYYGDSIHVDILRAQSNIGLSYSWEGDYLSAIPHFEKAIVDQERFAIFPNIYNRTKLGECYRLSGDPASAIRDFDIALETISRGPGRDSISWEKASSFFHDLVSNRINAMSARRQWELALEQGKLGLELLRRIVDPSDSLRQLTYVRLTLGKICLDATAQEIAPDSKNSLAKGAEDHFQGVLEASLLTGDTLQAIYGLNGVGAALFAQKQYARAVQVITPHLIWVQQTKLASVDIGVAGLLTSLGSSYVKSGDLQRGLHSYAQAMQHISGERYTWDSLPPVRKMYQDGYLTALYLLGSIGRTHLLLSERDPIHRRHSGIAYDSLAALLNYVRANLVSDEAKIQLAEEARQWLPDAVADLSALYFAGGGDAFKERALQMAEQGKTFLLMERSRLNSASDLLPPHLLRKQFELSAVHRRALQFPELQPLADSLQWRYLEALRRDAPAYHQLRFGSAEVGLQGLQDQLLSSGQALIEYVAGEETLYIFAFNGKQFALDTVQISKEELRRHVSIFRENMNPAGADGLRSAERASQFSKTAHTLYELLIGKVQIDLPERLILIPDDVLSDLPFDALLRKVDLPVDDIPRQVGAGNFLIQSKSLSYGFSIRTLQQMTVSPPAELHCSSLKIFVPEFSRQSSELPHLVYQEMEARAIGERVYGAEIIRPAKKQQFLEALRTCAYVHLSAHGNDSPNPDSSYLAFSQQSEVVDSSALLYLRELYLHPVQSELITLTACETALGQHRAGEGNISIARGLAYSGARSFITALWKIQTQGASKIIPAFYENLFEYKMPKDVALAESKRQYLRAGKAVYPDDWAGLILIGSTQAVVINSSFVLPRIQLFALLALVSGVFYVWLNLWRKRQKQSRDGVAVENG